MTCVPHGVYAERLLTSGLQVMFESSVLRTVKRLDMARLRYAALKKGVWGCMEAPQGRAATPEEATAPSERAALCALHSTRLRGCMACATGCCVLTMRLSAVNAHNSSASQVVVHTSTRKPTSLYGVRTDCTWNEAQTRVLFRRTIFQDVFPSVRCWHEVENGKCCKLDTDE